MKDSDFLNGTVLVDGQDGEGGCQSEGVESGVFEPRVSILLAFL